MRPPEPDPETDAQPDPEAERLARAAAAERERERRERERAAAREAAREYDEERARERAEARANLPPAPPPLLLAAPAVHLHRDAVPALTTSAGVAAPLLSDRLRVGLAFAFTTPARMTQFADDGAVRRSSALGFRGLVAWRPLSRPVSPLFSLSAGADVLRFTQDGEPVADVTVPTFELSGGASLAPLPQLALEPFVGLRVHARRVPLDVEGTQATTLLPVAFVGGVQLAVTPSQQLVREKN